MLSWQLVDFGKPLEPRESPTPVPHGTEVLVRVAACGVCHSDVHLWDGFFDYGNGNKLSFAASMPLPFTIGHEIVGTVVAVGPDATGIQVGQQSVIFPWIGCGVCDVCTSGGEYYCSSRVSIGTKRAGGFADHVLVPHPRYLFDFEGVPAALACTYACSGVTAYSALKKVPALTAQDTLLLIGAGGVGLSALLIAPALTAAKLVVADIDPAKRQAALAAGADAVIDNSTPAGLAELKKFAGGGIWAAIDFVGAPSSAQFGIDSLRRGGTLLMVGLFGGALSLPLAMVSPRLLTIRGSHVGSLVEMGELMALAKAGRIKPIPVAKRPMSLATTTLEDLRAGRIVGRVVLEPAA